MGIGSLDDLLQACVAALNGTGLEAQDAVAKPVRVAIGEELCNIAYVMWDSDSDRFVIVV